MRARSRLLFIVVLWLTAGVAVAGSSTAIEYFHRDYGHYFVTASSPEIAALDAGSFAGWSRTGQSFDVLGLGAPSAANVCRFWSGQAFAPKSSHFYTPFDWECTSVRQNRDWEYEGEVFAWTLPDNAGACSGGTIPLYRLYNDGRSGAPNHRYTTNPTTRAQMIAQGWTAEGSGTGVIGCVPSSSTPAACAAGAVPGIAKWSLPDLWVPTDVVVTDIDGDGRVDVLALAMFGTDSLQRQQGLLSVYRQTVRGAFCAPETYAVGGYPWRLAVGDIDGDGAPDVVVTDTVHTASNPPHMVWLLRQDATRRGLFLAPQLLASNGKFLYVAAIADVNGDGAADVVAADGLGTGGSAAVLLQTPEGRGAFLPPQPISLPGPATCVVAGDANGDHRTDLAFWVVTSYVDYTPTGSMAMLRQTASGALATAELSLRITGLNVQRMAMTDHDRDGRSDVVLYLTPQSADYQGRIVTAIQQPSNAFTGIETSLAGVKGIDDAAISDFDGDGRPDVAVAGFWPERGGAVVRSRVNIFASSGGGGFVQRAQYDVQPYAVSRLAAGDVDGDGRPDLVLLDGDNAIWVMLQSRTVPGTFDPPRPVR